MNEYEICTETIMSAFFWDVASAVWQKFTNLLEAQIDSIIRVRVSEAKGIS
jgi:hypothetical protein